jgi:hypothetical protein
MKESTPKLDGLVENILSDLVMDELPKLVQVPSMIDFSEVSDLSSVVEMDMPVVDDVVDLSGSAEVHSVSIDLGLPKRVVSNDNVKTLTLDSPYDTMSLKELKEKVAEINGPKLKTKKELMDYLKNKK